MLDIPELDDIIYQRLAPRDMAQCARVCKKWHFVVISYLWRDLRCLKEVYKRRYSFCKMVHDDYLREQQHHKLQDKGHTMEQSTQDQQSPLSPLSKYGSQIRTLPNPAFLGRTLRSREWILHLFSLCPSDVRIETLEIRFEDLSLARGNPWKSIVDFTLPHLQQLNINICYEPPRLGISRLMTLLDQCSTVLEKLKLSVRIYDDNLEVQTENGPNCWPSLKELDLDKCVDKTDTKRFWSWLFRRCNGVERLIVNQCVGIFQSLEQGMQTQMPILRDFTLECREGKVFEMTGDVTAALLSCSRKGLKAARFGYETLFSKASMDALANNFTTLEIVQTQGSNNQSANDIIQVLRSCTNLHSLEFTNPRSLHLNSWYRMDGRVFIDQDPDTGSLVPWKCERSLKVLKITINGIPKAGMGAFHEIAEAYPGQGREIQGLVYDRLVRISNLETLWLGDSYHYSLELSLESGLDKLSELRSLKELRSMSSGLRFGVKEAQWMVEHLPRLRRLGINWYRSEACEWLQEHHPEIDFKGKA